MLVEQRTKAHTELALPITTETLSLHWQQQWNNLPSGKWEVCPVCRLRPKTEDAEVCEHCRKRRDSRIAWWQDNPTQTIWIDEIADHNDRLVLIVGKFGLEEWLSGDLVQTLLVKAVENNPNGCVSKNPSPARLRRIWETTQRFWDQTVTGILTQLPDRTRWELIPDATLAQHLPPEQTVCDGTLNGQPISVFRIGNRLLTISFAAELYPGTLRISWEERKRKRRTELVISRVCKAEGELAKYRCYRPVLTLLTSPDQFFVLVPASDALEVAEKIRQAYTREFGKVQNRLPLFLGLVFFQRKMPLMAVMDMARRMLEQVEFQEESWKIAKVENGQITFEHGFSWNVPTTMGDGSPDIWYPYFFVIEDSSSYQFCFQVKEGKYKNCRLVRVSEELEDKEVWVLPSRFAYIYLEHTAQRFEFDPQKEGMLLEDLPRLIKMWEGIRKTPAMTDTKLQAIRALFEAKWQLWRLAERNSTDYPQRRETFKQLLEITLRRDHVTAVSIEDVLEGRFRRCLDLYLQILKQHVKEREHEQYSESETV